MLTAFMLFSHCVEMSIALGGLTDSVCDSWHVRYAYPCHCVLNSCLRSRQEHIPGHKV